MTEGALVKKGMNPQSVHAYSLQRDRPEVLLQAEEVTVEDEDHEHRRLQENMKEVIKKDAEVYVKVESYTDVSYCLATKNHVTLTGSSGCGKTAMARQLLRDYSANNFDVLIVDEPNELKHDRDPLRPTVVLVDDVFGQDGFPSEYIYKWEHSLENELSPLIGYGSKRPSNLKLIFTSQSKCFEEAVENMAYLRETVFHDNFVFDVSMLTETDKKNIIKKHKKKSLVDIDRPTIRELCQLETPLGFPRTCQKLFLQKFCWDPVAFFKDSNRTYLHC